METNIEEIWKDVVGYEGYYQISSLGRIKSLARKGKRKDFIMKSHMSRGYSAVVITKNSIQKAFYVHRLVCIAFLPNPCNKPDVNHKNCIKTDNRLSNLEWSTEQENLTHAKINGRLIGGGRPRKQKMLIL